MRSAASPHSQPGIQDTHILTRGHTCEPADTPGLMSIFLWPTGTFLGKIPSVSGVHTLTFLSSQHVEMDEETHRHDHSLRHTHALQHREQPHSCAQCLEAVHNHTDWVTHEQDACRPPETQHEADSGTTQAGLGG